MSFVVLSGLVAVAPAAAGQHGSAARKPDVHFVVTRQPVVEEMLRLARVRRSDVVYDLGSGDGRIVITAARRYGALGVGIELDTQLIRVANQRAGEAGVSGRVRFVREDLFSTNLRPATVVTMFLGPVLHARLRPILYRELRPGARIVAHGWAMGEWEPDARTVADGRELFCWIVPARVEGTWRWRARDGSAHALLLEQRYQAVSGRWVRDRDTVRIAAGRLAGDSLMLRAAAGGAVFRFAGGVRTNTLSGAVVRNGRVERWTARRTD
jgi:SAM-dependent methyltransferase